MRRTLPFLFLVVAGCAEPARAARQSTGPVLLELFTSQGCSSCPPADEWVSELKNDPRVIPLAFHVTYWDDLGWKDRFSAETWTARQKAYAGRLGGGVYTPEMVIGGAAHAVGSRKDKILAHVAGTAPAGGGPCLAAVERDDAIVISASCAPPEGADFWAAVVEDGLVTEISRGENKGRTLRQDAVVRALVRVDDGTRIPRHPDWGRVGVVAFAQERAGLRVLSAGRLLPTPP
jgi:hypothetical protein